jgi:NAD(P)-dependent dehydrogenase (short-subunit alcohol dehydrogenase family)
MSTATPPLTGPTTAAAADPALLGTTLGLTGHTVVVTGATSGIGEAVALGLAGAGMNVVAVGRRTEALDALATRAGESGGQLTGVIADVTDEDAIEQAMDTAVTRYGRLDAAVAVAGVAAVGPAIDMAASDFRGVFDTNVLGAFLTARAAARRMTDGGSIVLTGSNFGRRGLPDWAPYNSSKAAVAMLTETLATEWAPRGIRVNALAPGATLTPFNAALFADEAFTSAVVSGIPGGRILSVDELVLPVAFLLSPLNPMLLGQTLMVDGGQVL